MQGTEDQTGAVTDEHPDNETVEAAPDDEVDGLTADVDTDVEIDYDAEEDEA